jgi:hypothetical protein
VEGKESGQFRGAGLAVASWYQHISRDGDMQLHTRNQIAHVAFTRHDATLARPGCDSSASVGVVDVPLFLPDAL